MYFGVFEASPREGTPGFNRYAGARIACWVNTTNRKVARRRALALIKITDWDVTGTVEEKLVSSEIYSADHEGTRYYNQALTDGEVCAIVTHPKGT